MFGWKAQTSARHAAGDVAVWVIATIAAAMNEVGLMNNSSASIGQISETAGVRAVRQEAIQRSYRRARTLILQQLQLQAADSFCYGSSLHV